MEAWCMEHVQAAHSLDSIRNPGVMSRDRFEGPSDEDMRKAAQFFHALNAFRTIDPKIPANYVATFMCVAMRPGYGPTEYAKALGTIQPVVSRWLLEIGVKARAKEEPLRLVDRDTDPNNLRQQRYFLTAKGTALFNQVMRIMGD